MTSTVMQLPSGISNTQALTREETILTELGGGDRFGDGDKFCLVVGGGDAGEGPYFRIGEFPGVERVRGRGKRP